MNFIIAIIAGLLLTACTVISPKSPQVIPIKQLPNSSEFTEFNSFENNLSMHGYDIEGRYKLHRGLFMNGNVNQGEITHAYMIVDKLDENDFGYYFADKTNQLSAESTFGIFHYDEDDKTFHQKLIDGDSFVIRKGGIELIKAANKLKLTIRQSIGRKVIIWEKIKSDDIVVLDDSIDAALEQARDAYVQIYENNKEKAIDDSLFLGIF
jgi:hypothetical protein